MTEKSDLFLLPPEFADAAYPGERFLCKHGALVEGVLASFPKLAGHLNIHRVAFPRPRPEVVALLGPDHQALPVLVLPDGQTSAHSTGVAGGREFVTGAEPILALFAERFGAPVVHP